MSVVVRIILEKLCAARGEDFAGLSRMLGRNPVYIQQFIRRRTQAAQGSRPAQARPLFPSPVDARWTRGGGETRAGLVPVKRTLVQASAGAGAYPADEPSKPYFAFDERWLRALTGTAAGKLSIIRVEGESMAPTLNAGDDILVDLGDCMERLRDGIYVLRADDVLVVKRLAMHPAGRGG